MTLSLIVYKIHGNEGIWQYLNASDRYISDPRARHMDYPGFPNIRESCPVCGLKDCAIFKGYYQRHFICIVLKYFGKVAIRRGVCQTRGNCFSFLPDFMVCKKPISVLSLFRLFEEKRFGLSISKIMDRVLSGLDDVFQLGVSTIYGYFFFLSRLISLMWERGGDLQAGHLLDMTTEDRSHFIYEALNSTVLTARSPPDVKNVKSAEVWKRF